MFITPKIDKISRINIHLMICTLENGIKFDRVFFFSVFTEGKGLALGKEIKVEHLSLYYPFYFKG